MIIKSSLNLEVYVVIGIGYIAIPIQSIVVDTHRDTIAVSMMSFGKDV